MLKTKKKVVITGESLIEENVVCTFVASIDYEEPEKMSITQFRKDKEAYKKHCEECRADYAAFEDLAWEAQAEVAKKVGVELD